MSIVYANTCTYETYSQGTVMHVHSKERDKTKSSIGHLVLYICIYIYTHTFFFSYFILKVLGFSQCKTGGRMCDCLIDGLCAQNMPNPRGSTWHQNTVAAVKYFITFHLMTKLRLFYRPVLNIIFCLLSKASQIKSDAKRRLLKHNSSSS